METLSVEAPSRTYDILIGRDIIERLGAELAARRLVDRRRPVAVLTSPRIGSHYFDGVRLSLEKQGVAAVRRWDIPDGEEHKNLREYGNALDWLARTVREPGTTPLVITLGGGVVGDLGGFVAHTYKRGVPFVQVTTTLLGMVDCSVGGKTAVNLPTGKNLVGAFHQPSLVMADLDCLNTLAEAEIRSGMAEVIKYGIALDAGLLEILERDMDALMQLDAERLVPVVKRCCEIKAAIVQRDEYDREGVRVSLNFGHTLGHAIENVCGYARTHGECVAAGMVAAARLSVRLGLCDPQVAGRLESLLLAAGLPVDCRGLGLDPDQVMDVMKQDKKWVHGTNRFVLLTGAGSWKDVEGVGMERVREVVGEVLGA